MVTYHRNQHFSHLMFQTMLKSAGDWRPVSFASPARLQTLARNMWRVHAYQTPLASVRRARKCLKSLYTAVNRSLSRLARILLVFTSQSDSKHNSRRKICPMGTVVNSGKSAPRFYRLIRPLEGDPQNFWREVRTMRTPLMPNPTAIDMQSYQNKFTTFKITIFVLN